MSVEVVKLAGSVEIAPGLGLADCIVDVVETGRTLEENGLEAVEEVAPSSARLVVNRASYHARREEVSRLIETLRRAVGMRTLRYGTAAWRRYLAGLPRAARRPGRGSSARSAAIVRAVRARRRRGAAALRRPASTASRLDARRPAGGPPARCSALAATRGPAASCSPFDDMARRIEAFHRRQLDRGFRMRLADGSVLEERVSARAIRSGSTSRAAPAPIPRRCS